MAKPYKSSSKRITNPTNAGTDKSAVSIKKQPKSVASKDIVSGKRAKPANVTLATGRAAPYKPNKSAKLARGNVIAG